MRRRLILLAAACLLAGPGSTALASTEKAPEPAEGNHLDIAQVALPIVYDGRLVNYIFVSVRLQLTKSANVPALRAKEPFFRDALIRLAHRRPFTRLDDFTVVDEGALKAAFGPEAARIAGPRAVTAVQIMMQAPKQRAGMPRPPQAKSAPPKPAAH